MNFPRNLWKFENTRELSKTIAVFGKFESFKSSLIYTGARIFFNVFLKVFVKSILRYVTLRSFLNSLSYKGVGGGGGYMLGGKV